MYIFVTGGAGYIGSICSEELINAGHQVTIFVNLTEGHRKAVEPRAKFIEGDLAAPALSVSASGAVHGKVKVGDIKSEGELAGEFDADTVQLYLQETLTFLNYTAEASVALAP